MSRWTRVSLVVALCATALGGCKTSVIDTLGDLADEMCECQDEACAKAALAKFKSHTASNPVVQADAKSEAAMAGHIARFVRCRIERLPADVDLAPGGARYVDPEPDAPSRSPK